MNKLTSCRNEVDAINKKILILLKKRTALSKKIGEYKKKEGLQIVDKAREKELFAEIKKEAKKLNLNYKEVEIIFKEIVKLSRKVQK
jgi:chorismate mutase